MSPMPLAFAVTLILKATLLLAAGALLALMLRRRSAAARHEVWTSTLVIAVALAALAPLAPSLPVPLMPAREPATATPAVSHEASTGAAPIVSDEAPARRAPSSAVTAVKATSASGALTAIGIGGAAAALWALGSLVVVLSCTAGHFGLRRLARAARPLDDGEWPALLAEACALAQVRRPVTLCASERVATPLTWGARRPIVVFPAGAESWPVERRRAALLHELAHVARNDYLAQLAGTLSCALYWFHPAAWMALRRLRIESERACDDKVLAVGTPAAEYASQLLAVARDAGALRHAGAAVAIGMARPSTLEGRLLAVLDESTPRRARSPRLRVAAATLAAVALVPFAGLVPVARAAGVVPAVLEGGTLTASMGSPVTTGAVTVRSSSTPDRSTERGSKGGGQRFDRSLAATAGEELTLDLETGAGVTIRGWDESRVDVEVQLGGDDWRGSRVDVERAQGGVRVHSWQEARGRSTSTSHRLSIRVPRRFDVRLESAGGDLTIEDVEGSFTGSTGGGEITLARLRGSARLSTGGGEVRVSDSTLDGSVNTGGGLVTLSRISGKFRGNSGSGPVIYADPAGGEDEALGTGDLSALEIEDSGDIGFDASDAGDGADALGVLHISRAGGDVRLAAAPHGAEITTGGGKVVVGRSAGLVDASTGGGDVTIGPAAGSVRASTGAGRVQVTMVDAGSEEQTVEVKSGSGAVVIELPAGFDGTLDLETAYTRSFGRATRIDAPGELTRETTGWDDRYGSPRRYVRARGKLGTGRGLVRVVTVNGDVEVRLGS